MMKKMIMFLTVSVLLASCEKDDFPTRPFKDNCCKMKTEEVTFADMGMCSGMWFERDCGGVFEVYNYFPEGVGFCGTPYPLQPGERVTINYKCYDDSDLIQCEALSAYEADCHEKGRKITTVEVVHETVIH